MKVSTNVWCYSGHTYAERPQSFLWEGQVIEVATIEKTWREPGERHFRVRTKGDWFFEICYDELQDEWSVMESEHSVDG